MGRHHKKCRKGKKQTYLTNNLSLAPNKNLNFLFSNNGYNYYTLCGGPSNVFGNIEEVLVSNKYAFRLTAPMMFNSHIHLETSVPLPAGSTIGLYIVSYFCLSDCPTSMPMVLTQSVSTGTSTHFFIHMTNTNIDTTNYYQLRIGVPTSLDPGTLSLLNGKINISSM